MSLIEIYANGETTTLSIPEHATIDLALGKLAREYETNAADCSPRFPAIAKEWSDRRDAVLRLLAKLNEPILAEPIDLPELTLTTSH